MVRWATPASGSRRPGTEQRLGLRVVNARSQTGRRQVHRRSRCSGNAGSWREIRIRCSRRAGCAPRPRRPASRRLDEPDVVQHQHRFAAPRAASRRAPARVRGDLGSPRSAISSPSPAWAAAQRGPQPAASASRELRVTHTTGPGGCPRRPSRRPQRARSRTAGDQCDRVPAGLVQQSQHARAGHRGHGRLRHGEACLVDWICRGHFRPRAWNRLSGGVSPSVSTIRGVRRSPSRHAGLVLLGSTPCRIRSSISST